MARLYIWQIMKAGETVTDEEYMQMALDLAEKARGCTSPNPLVGCVIVNPEGRSLAKATTQSRPAPCGNHGHGGCREPGGRLHRLCDPGALLPLRPYGPCCEALIRAGIKKVVAAADDPNPKVAGRGFARLQGSGGGSGSGGYWRTKPTGRTKCSCTG